MRDEAIQAMSGWLKYMGKKTVRLVTLLVFVAVASFTLVTLSPVDPLQAYIGADIMRVGPEQRQAISEYWGLNEPPVAQFMRWSGALLSGDWGTSMIYRQPVLDVIQERFVSSLALMSVSWILAGVIGFLAGLLSAMTRDRWVDRAITWLCYTLASTPTFWLGLLMMMIFAVWLGWFPVGLGVPSGVAAGDVTVIDRLRHLALPALTLSIVGISPIALHTRAKLIDVMKSDYWLYAMARGERPLTRLRRHGLRNVALPAITLQFASFGELFGGAVLAEQVFSYPGLGQAMVESGLRGDVPLLMGLVLCSALFIFVGNALADLLYWIIDPRMQRGKAALNE
jgi:peptide/nickel transport system permease protein